MYYENSVNQMDLSKIKSLSSQRPIQSSATNAMKITNPNQVSKMRKSQSIQSARNRAEHVLSECKHYKSRADCSAQASRRKHLGSKDLNNTPRFSEKSKSPIKVPGKKPKIPTCAFENRSPTAMLSRYKDSI